MGNEVRGKLGQEKEIRGRETRVDMLGKKGNTRKRDKRR